MIFPQQTAARVDIIDSSTAVYIAQLIKSLNRSNKSRTTETVGVQQTTGDNGVSHEMTRLGPSVTSNKLQIQSFLDYSIYLMTSYLFLSFLRFGSLHCISHVSFCLRCSLVCGHWLCRPSSSLPFRIPLESVQSRLLSRCILYW